MPAVPNETVLCCCVRTTRDEVTSRARHQRRQAGTVLALISGNSLPSRRFGRDFNVCMTRDDRGTPRAAPDLVSARLTVRRGRSVD